MNQDNPAPLAPSAPSAVPQDLVQSPFPATLPTVFGDDEENKSAASETGVVEEDGGGQASSLDDLPPLGLPNESPSGSGVPEAAAEGEVVAEEKGLPSLDDLNAMMQTGQAAQEEAAVTEDGADLPSPGTLPGETGGLPEVEINEALPEAEEKLPEITDVLPDSDSLSLQADAPASDSLSVELPTVELPSVGDSSTGEAAGDLPGEENVASSLPLPEGTEGIGGDQVQESVENSVEENLPSLTETLGGELSTGIGEEPSPVSEEAVTALGLGGLSINELAQEPELPGVGEAGAAAETVETPEIPAEMPTELSMPMPAPAPPPPEPIAAAPLASPIVAPTPDLDLENFANLDPKLIIDQQLAKLDQEMAELKQKVAKMKQASESLRKEIEQKQYSAQVIDYALNSGMSRMSECEQQKQDLLSAKSQIN